MRIDYQSVHFTTEEAFQLLHNQDLKLWMQVIDLLADAADDLYSLTPGAKLHYLLLRMELSLTKKECIGPFDLPLLPLRFAGVCLLNQFHH